MRGNILIFLMMSLVMSLCVLITLAHAEEQKAQLWFVEEVVVKPSMVEKYEAHTKEALALCEKYGLPFPFYGFTTDDFRYYFVWPIENYASLDSLFKAIGEWVAKMGDENWQALLKSGEGTYAYLKTSIVRHRPELSYIPAKPRLKPEEANFVSIDFYYIQPGKEKEFEEVCKDYNALDKRKKIPDGYSIAVMAIGTDMPLYIGLARGKNASDLFSHWEKQQELEGSEGKEIWRKTRAVCRKFEDKTGWFRPDLSYIPEKK